MEIVSVNDLVLDLHNLGVQPGDTLMVHASLRKIGPVQSRAEGVLQALGLAVGPKGTLLMTIGAKDDWSWVNARAEMDRPALLANAVPFNCLATPSDPDMGVLAEVFRQLPATVVSDHPEGRFAASGRLASELLHDVPWNDYYGPHSPLARFVERSGRVLRLGADLDTLTLLHYAEYLVDLPEKRRVRRHRLVDGPNGPVIRTIDCLDDSDGIVDVPEEDYFETLLRDYLATGRANMGLVGLAPSELFEAPDVLRYGIAWMADHLAGRETGE